MLVLNIHCAQLIVKALKQLAAIAANFFKKLFKNPLKRLARTVLKIHSIPDIYQLWLGRL